MPNYISNADALAARPIMRRTVSRGEWEVVEDGSN